MVNATDNVGQGNFLHYPQWGTLPLSGILPKAGTDPTLVRNMASPKSRCSIHVFLSPFRSAPMPAAAISLFASSVNYGLRYVYSKLSYTELKATLDAV